MALFDFIGDIFGGGDKETTQTQTNDIRQLPDYAEAEGARAKWWDTLQKWAGQPGYGAISPDWNNIWENARQKVQRHFFGGPEGPGLNATVRANAARRGVADSATGDTLLQRSGFQQGNMLMDLAVKQAMDEVNLGEKGRETWLGSVQNLAGLKPSFMNYGSTSTRTTEGSDPIADIFQQFGIGEAASAGMSGGGIFDQLMGMFGGNDDDSGIGDVMGQNDEKDGFDWQEALKIAGPLLMSFI